MNDQDGVARQLGNLVLIEMARGNLDVAETTLDRALAIHTSLGDEESIAKHLNNRAYICIDRGLFPQAFDQASRARELYAKVGAASLVEGVDELLAWLSQQLANRQ